MFSDFDRERVLCALLNDLRQGCTLVSSQWTLNGHLKLERINGVLYDPKLIDGSDVAKTAVCSV